MVMVMAAAKARFFIGVFLSCGDLTFPCALTTAAYPKEGASSKQRSPAA
jgi:hypothetical protein